MEICLRKKHAHQEDLLKINYTETHCYTIIRIESFLHHNALPRRNKKHAHQEDLLKINYTETHCYTINKDREFFASQRIFTQDDLSGTNSVPDTPKDDITQPTASDNTASPSESISAKDRSTTPFSTKEKSNYCPEGVLIDLGDDHGLTGEPRVTESHITTNSTQIQRLYTGPEEAFNLPDIKV